MIPTMQGLVEDVMYVYQGEIPMSGVDDVYQWMCACRLILPRSLINQ